MSDIPLSWESPKPPDNGNDVTDSREIWAAGLIQVLFWGITTRESVRMAKNLFFVFA